MLSMKKNNRWKLFDNSKAVWARTLLKRFSRDLMKTLG